MSLGSRLFNVFAVPGEVFDFVKNSAASAANWVAPALILIAVSWLAGWLVLSQDSVKQQISEITDKAIQKQIEKSNMPPDQAEKVREAGAKYGNIGTMVSVAAAPVFAGFITPFWGGLILWLVGTKVMKGHFGYMKAVEVVGLGQMVAVLEAAVKTLMIISMGNLFASPSAAMLLGEFDPQNPVHGLLSAVNVMTFWLLAVRSIGLARLASVSFAKAAGWVFGIWLLFTGIMTGFGYAMQLIFNR
jgi:hypothetical protein